MKLSVIILNYNVRYFLELCLKSVERAIEDIDAEIIVIDNNSKDDSCTMVRESFPNVRLVENNENFGFSKGNNIGVEKANGEYLCVLNPDTVVAEDIFEKILKFSESKDKLGIVGCRLINGIGEFLPESKRNIPYVKAALLKLIGDSKKYYANHLNENETGKVDVLVGAFMFVRKTVYIEMNGFDEDYFMYGEDIDLSYKVLKSGYNNYYYGETTVIHYKGESTLRDKKYAERFYGAMQIFYKKHFKKNVIFDCLVWIGIKLVSGIRSKSIARSKKVSKYVFVSNNPKGVKDSFLDEKLLIDYEMKYIEDGDEVVFDANVLRYKSIIGFLEDLKKQNKITFKILPHEADYIIGSDDAIHQGEILKWN